MCHQMQPLTQRNRSQKTGEVECCGAVCRAVCRGSPPLRLKLPLLVGLHHPLLEPAAAHLWSGAPQQILRPATLLLDEHLAILTGTATPPALLLQQDIVKHTD